LEKLWRDIRLLQQEARITNHELGAVTSERRHSGAAASTASTAAAAATTGLTISTDADTDADAIAVVSTDHPEDLVAVTALRAEIAAAQVTMCANASVLVETACSCDTFTVMYSAKCVAASCKVQATRGDHQ
jgi:hypothetical protein